MSASRTFAGDSATTLGKTYSVDDLAESWKLISSINQENSTPRRRWSLRRVSATSLDRMDYSAKTLSTSSLASSLPNVYNATQQPPQQHAVPHQKSYSESTLVQDQWFASQINPELTQTVPTMYDFQNLASSSSSYIDLEDLMFDNGPTLQQQDYNFPPQLPSWGGLEHLFTPEQTYSQMPYGNSILDAWKPMVTLPVAPQLPQQPQRPQIPSISRPNIAAVPEPSKASSLAQALIMPESATAAPVVKQEPCVHVQEAKSQNEPSSLPVPLKKEQHSSPASPPHTVPRQRASRRVSRKTAVVASPASSESSPSPSRASVSPSEDDREPLGDSVVAEEYFAPPTAPFSATPSAIDTVDTPRKMICKNCLITSTPFWRRSVHDELLCNACGLYLKLHGRHRPQTLVKSAVTAPVVDAPATKCSNCETLSTPLWRKNDQGKPLCNACGLFYKLHHRARPANGLAGASHVTRKRNRAARSSKSDESEDSDEEYSVGSSSSSTNKRTKA
ncbi:hypothetical protein SmJEL517_g01970 [Synchytrium microbalum]|uniref:GATA-type domain-containing protein n=1 Tax=Synchytrium microbalum TaxID=1806994 RepID=A0A507C8R5_9FUNG|nr:uncharacterized protein SmJEL517_g01970 [Synchytrium microbalum]TPX35728.1 hypothetical protein SmJEL517_g01970 [Synchytrium microbalum]